MKGFAALATVLALCACADNGGLSPAVDNGQTGSPGGTGGGTAGSPPERTCAEHDCVAEIAARYASDFAAQSRPVRVISSECVEMSIAAPIDSSAAEEGFGESYMLYGPMCACRTDRRGRYYIGSDEVGCAVRGHAHDCVMWHGESDLCDLSDPTACEGVCAELDERLRADAMKSKPFVVRSARCTEHDVYPDYTTTECSESVIEIDGYCYDALSFPPDWNNWQSCELDDQEIFSAPRPVLPDCDDIPESVPATADCRPACDDASDCRYAQGCDYGPSDEGFGRSGRGRCWTCTDDAQCLPTETCANYLCVLRGNAECDLDEDCEPGTVCTPSEVAPDGRGNEGLTLRCLPQE